MRIANENMIPSGAVDAGSSFNLSPVYLGHICNYSMQVTLTGTVAGTLTLQCSDDPVSPDAGTVTSTDGVVNYSTVKGSSLAVSGAGSYSYNVQNAGYNWVRLVYTATSGAGSLTVARINVKGA